MAKQTKKHAGKDDDGGKGGHRRGSGVSHVYEKLRNEIIELKLEPGSPIDELQLAQRFALSRTPIREALVRLAAANHRDGDVGRIRAAQEQFANAVGARDALAMIAANRDFHLEIASTGRNRYYAELFRQLLDEGRRILRLYYSSFQDALPKQYVTEHEDMIAAVAARDVQEADRLAALHAAQIVRHIQASVTADTGVNSDLRI